MTLQGTNKRERGTNNYLFKLTRMGSIVFPSIKERGDAFPGRVSGGVIFPLLKQKKKKKWRVNFFPAQTGTPILLHFFFFYDGQE